MVGTWMGEIHSCSCLAVLPDSALVLLNKIYQPFFTSLYNLDLNPVRCTDKFPSPSIALFAHSLVSPSCVMSLHGFLVPISTIKTLALQQDKAPPFVLSSRIKLRSHANQPWWKTLLSQALSTFSGPNERTFRPFDLFRSSSGVFS